MKIFIDSNGRISYRKVGTSLQATRAAVLALSVTETHVYVEKDIREGIPENCKNSTYRLEGIPASEQVSKPQNFRKFGEDDHVRSMTIIVNSGWPKYAVGLKQVEGSVGAPLGKIEVARFDKQVFEDKSSVEAWVYLTENREQFIIQTYFGEFDEMLAKARGIVDGMRLLTAEPG